MNWPLAWRSSLEHEQRQNKSLRVFLAEAKDEVKELHRESIGILKTEADRYDDLVKTIVSMKREGFEPQLFPEMESPEEPDLPAEIWIAIGEVSEKGSAEYQSCVNYAMEYYNDRMHTTAMIVERILQGQDVEV